MSNWFSKATNAFKGPVDDTPRPFEMECECGVKHAGLRKKSPQRIVCRECGSSLFILPRDIYPAARPVSATVKEPAARVAVVEEAPEPGMAPVQSVLDDVVILDDESTRGPRKPRRKVADPVVEKAPTPRKPPEKLLRPYHFVLAAIGLVLLITGFFAMSSRNREHALLTYKDEAEKGMAAVGEQKWVEAQSHLELAANAADVLSRDDPESTRIRQYRTETTAMNLLATASLVDILDEAERTLPDNYDSWLTDFHSKYVDRWLILELPARRVKPDPQEEELQTVIEWSIPAAGGGRPIEIEAIPALDKLSLTDEPRTVILGVQLESVTWEKANRRDEVGKWIVRFNPETSILWTDLDAYQGAGMTFSDDYRPSRSTEEALRRQREALGLEAAPEAVTAEGDTPVDPPPTEDQKT